MPVKAGEPLYCSQACWAVSDFNTNQSSPQHEWRLQCCFFMSCSFSRDVWVICRVYRDIVPHPSGLQQLLIGVQKCNQGHKTAGAHAGRVNWNYSTWILARNTRVKETNPPNELLRRSVAVTSRMFVFHLLHGTAHTAAVSHLTALLGLLFRTDSEETVPLNGGTHSMVNHCVTSSSLGVFLRDLVAHSSAFLPNGWMGGRAGAVRWQHKEHRHCRQGAPVPAHCPRPAPPNQYTYA